MIEPVTLDAHIRSTAGPEAGDLAVLFTQLAAAGKIIARELARAALVGQLGTTGETNVQGEKVKKLDAWSNDVVVRAMEETGLVTTLVSEEMAEPLPLAKAGARGRYVVCVDPVDGSSNLDVNGVVGTIFSIRSTPPGGGAAPSTIARGAMQPGTAQVAAGYIMYGPSTLLVLTSGDTVDGFTLDPTLDGFVCTHHRIRIPVRGRTYSVNEGNVAKWEPGVQRYVEYLKDTDVATGRPYTARYVGSLVADFHRTLLEGGIYLYPAEAQRSEGKLRLQYEAAPMGFIVERAGGRASTGRERIMTIEPATPHQRVPLLIGSPEDVALAEDFIAGRQR
jgi:fructose-1,6-bisphosphatase I